MSKDARPNIILLVMDTQRAKDMSCYGYEKKTTPHIDKLAEEGTLFVNNISPGVWSLPSYASIMTGKYPSSHGADMQHEYLESSFLRLPEVLRELGYTTAGLSFNGWCSIASGLQRGFAEWRDSQELSRAKSDPRVSEQLKERDEEFDRGSLALVIQLIDWLQEHQDKEEPFFLYANFTEPHAAYRPPQPFRKRFLPPEVTDDEAAAISQDGYVELAGKIKRSAREWQILRALYNGETAVLDARLGIFFDYLTEAGLVDNTILILTGDHGDEIGEHPPFMHHVLTIYDSVIRVPLIVRYPSLFPRGKRVEYVTQTLDIFPTLMEMLKVEDEKVLGEIQGKSLLGAVSGKEPREFAVTDYSKPLQTFERLWRRYPYFDLRPLNRSMRAISTTEYKYIWRSDGRDELYHIKTDSDEQENLIHQEPEILQELKGKLASWVESIPQASLPDWLNLNAGAGKSASLEAIRRLKHWGYYL